MALATPLVLFLGTSIPWLWLVPLTLLLVGLEGRWYQRLLRPSVLLLDPSGVWRLGDDPMPWQLAGRNLHPGLMRLRFQRPGGIPGQCQLVLLRDQMDADEWRTLGAWLASGRSVAPVRPPDTR